MSQIAVREDAEGAMRAPTAEEAAALAGSSTETATAVPLQNGGVALRRDASQMSFAIVEIGEDGKARLTHGPASKVAPATSTTGKGASNGR